MSDPTFSIVTPSYNQREYITDNLDSVKNQAYEEVEHIVVDGASTDGTVEVLEEYEDRYDLTWISELDDGQADASNKGFDIATGDIVGWINSDDVYFDSGVLARVADYFDTYSCDVLYGDMAYINKRSYVHSIEPTFEFDPAELGRRNPIGHPSVFYRSGVLEENRLDDKLNHTMDLELYMRLIDRYTFKHVSDVLAGFRLHEDQKTANALDPEEPKMVRTRHGFTAPPDPPIWHQFHINILSFIRCVETITDISTRKGDLAFDGGFKPYPVILFNSTQTGKRINDPRR